MRRPPTNVDSQPAQCYDPLMSSENDNNLISFIATTVEALRARVDTMSDQMADQMATKVDLADLKDQMATNFSNLENRLANLEERVGAVEEQMATKDDLSLF